MLINLSVKISYNKFIGDIDLFIASGLSIHIYMYVII